MHIVDAHHHIWLREKLPWLNGPEAPRIFGAHAALRRDYAISEFAAEARSAGVTKSVFVQANCAKGGEVEEVHWARAEGKREGLVQATVGFADISSEDIAATLDAQLVEPGFRGVRQQLHWHEDPQYRFAPAPDVAASAAFRRGFHEVAARNLLFELQLFPGQYQHGLDLVDVFPNVPFVLLHAGMPLDPLGEEHEVWIAGLQDFAKRTNVVIKLSGFGTFRRRCVLDEWRPVIRQTIDIFGPSRCIFGSNFPIEKLWTSYARLVSVFKASIADLSTDEQAQILHGTAEAVYRI
jgi:predicted TIM-barrel fold metal-dependent hydrolase